MGKSEEMQTIYEEYDIPMETKFGKRAICEVGVIKNLEVDETKNYILIPFKKEGEKVTS